MKTATLGLVGVLSLSLPGLVMAALPAGKIAVVHVTAVDGLAQAKGEGTESRTPAYFFDGTEYRVSKGALQSLDGVQTLLFIDRRRDEMSGDNVTRTFTQEVRSFSTSSFTVDDVKGKVLSYQVAMIGGNLRLLGDSDQIQASAGSGGPFHIWKVTGYDLVDRSAITLE